MKVITEESFKRKIADYDLANCNLSELVIINELISEFQEIDTLTVSKLRPMIDAPEESCFVVHKDEPENLVWAYKAPYDNKMLWCLFNWPGVVPESDLIGWLSKPTYKPE